jgi:hypothetical protein
MNTWSFFLWSNITNFILVVVSADVIKYDKKVSINTTGFLDLLELKIYVFSRGLSINAIRLY